MLKNLNPEKTTYHMMRIIMLTGSCSVYLYIDVVMSTLIYECMFSIWLDGVFVDIGMI